MSPTPRTKRTPPSSPLLHPHPRLTLRPSTKHRLAILLLTTLLTLTALNELRCLTSGCASRFSLHRSDAAVQGAFAGGGAVLGEEWKYRVGEALRAGMLSVQGDGGAEQKKEKEGADVSGALVEMLNAKAAGGGISTGLGAGNDDEVEAEAGQGR